MTFKDRISDAFQLTCMMGGSRWQSLIYLNLFSSFTTVLPFRNGTEQLVFTGKHGLWVISLLHLLTAIFKDCAWAKWSEVVWLMLSYGRIKILEKKGLSTRSIVCSMGKRKRSISVVFSIWKHLKEMILKKGLSLHLLSSFVRFFFSVSVFP